MQRRRLIQLAAGAACGAAWPLAAVANVTRHEARASRALMGTRVDLAARGPDRAALESGFRAAFGRMEALVAMMSHYSATSRVAAMNLAAGLTPVAVPPEMMQVLQMAREVALRSDGAFDITVGGLGRWHFGDDTATMPDTEQIRRNLPSVDWRAVQLDERRGTAFLARRGMRIDLGGIAKLYILQEGLRSLQAQGIETALVNGGGDVVAAASRQERPWRVGIRDPRQPARLLAALEVREGFVASSGNYERFFVRDGRRFHHILDPRTGYPSEGPSGVTLVARELVGVNGLGAAVMVLGDAAGRDLLARTEGTQALIASAGGDLWVGEALRQRLVSPS